MFTQANQLHFNLDRNDSNSCLLPGQRSVDNLIIIEKVANDNRRRYNADSQSQYNVSDKLKLASKLAKLDVSNNSFGLFEEQPTAKAVRLQPRAKAVGRPVKPAKAYVPVKARKVDRPVQYKKPNQPTYLNSKKVPTAPIVQKTKFYKSKPLQSKVSHLSFENAMGGYDKEISLVEDFSKKLRQIIKKEKVMQQKILNRSLSNSFNKSNSFVAQKPKPKKPKSPAKSPVTRSPVIKKKMPHKKKVEETKSPQKKKAEEPKPVKPKPILQKSSSTSQGKVKKIDSRRAK